MTALVEYLLRLRIEEPTAAPTNGESGEVMADLLGEFEAACLETEIVSRVVLAGPGGPSRIRCSARSLDPSRHYATSTRWQIQTPGGETITTCSAACALSWFCHESAQADVEAARPDGETAA